MSTIPAESLWFSWLLSWSLDGLTFFFCLKETCCLLYPYAKPFSGSLAVLSREPEDAPG